MKAGLQYVNNVNLSSMVCASIVVALLKCEQLCKVIIVLIKNGKIRKIAYVPYVRGISYFGMGEVA